MKKITIFLTTCFCIISLCSSNVFANSQSFSWYCTRNKDHKQPLADANMRFVENYDGYYIDHKHSDTCEDKVIYLTFDAGYENGNIEKILDVLKEENVKAAFFVLKNLLDKNPELIARMEKEGHTVCNHTSKHPDITKIDSVEKLKDELRALEDRYFEITGKPMAKYFRPPEGRFDHASMQRLKNLGYKTIFWSFAYADWDNNSQMSTTNAKQKIFDNIHNGEVMLLHPTSETNAIIMKDVILHLKSQGFTFGTLDELTQ